MSNLALIKYLPLPTNNAQLMISITNFKAGYGDTFLVEISSAPTNVVRILIDCGFEFTNNVIPVLTEIGKEGKIDRFILTHFDSDHIASATSFLKANGKSSKPSIIAIDQIWLNTFRHLQFSKRSENELTSKEISVLSATISGLQNAVSTKKPDNPVSAKQGILTGAEILKMGYEWNSDFASKAACIEFNPDLAISEDVKLHLLSPNLKKLAELEKKFTDQLKKLNVNVQDAEIVDDAFELYNRWLDQQELIDKPISGINQNITKEKIIDLTTNYHYEKDESPGNGSSISFIIQNNEKRLLFLADAHAEDIIEQLKRRYVGITEYPLFFDLIKVAHHGSFKNNNPELYQMIDSDKFVFSTNGKHPKHKHPDVETIVQIINRPLPKGILVRTLFFNYDLDHLAFLKNEALKKHFNFDVCYDLQFSI